MSSFFGRRGNNYLLYRPAQMLLRLLASVNLPVDSITTCAPTDSQLMAAGSFSENTFTDLPATWMESPEALISCSGCPGWSHT